MFEVYKDKIKALIDKLYLPGTPSLGDHDLKMPLQEIVVQIASVIPKNMVDDTTVFECLEELGFIPQYESKTEVVIREIEGKKDAGGNQATQEDIIDVDDLAYFYYFKKRNDD